MANGEFPIIEFPLPMPTAIISIYTIEGFVIAADGRDYDWDSQKVMRDSVQKIYPVKHDNGVLACSFTGTDRVQAKGSETVEFDFIRQTMASTALLAETRLENLRDYATALLTSLCPLPLRARDAIRSYESPRQQTTIFIEGYYAGRAARAALIIPHDGSSPDISSGPATLGMPVGAHSVRVRESTLDPNSPLHRYSAQLSEIKTLSDAMKTAWRLMEAFQQPEAIRIDPKCKAVGGWTHMAIITPGDGFRWIKGPLQIN